MNVNSMLQWQFKPMSDFLVVFKRCCLQRQVIPLLWNKDKVLLNRKYDAATPTVANFPKGQPT